MFTLKRSFFHICLLLLFATLISVHTLVAYSKNYVETPKSSLSVDLSTGLNAFIDLSHRNTNTPADFAVAKKNGLVGFFHKATQHTNFEDNQYGPRVAEARKLGLLVGAYHFASAADVEAQVDFFLATIRKYGAQNIVPALDWEFNPLTTNQGSMSQEQASQFIEIFHQKTGIYPVIYGGYWMLDKLEKEVNIDSFSKAPLWQGFYSSAVGYLTGIWKDWVFLQYTDGVVGPEPHEFPGIGPIDRDIFNGNLEEANNFWKENSLKN